MIDDAPKIMQESSRELHTALDERIEKELRGAWRVGYDYLHVYDPALSELARGGPLSENFTVRVCVFPTNQKTPPNPSGKDYRYSYDLASVSDEEVRQAIREAGE